MKQNLTKEQVEKELVELNQYLKDNYKFSEINSEGKGRLYLVGLFPDNDNWTYQKTCEHLAEKTRTMLQSHVEKHGDILIGYPGVYFNEEKQAVKLSFIPVDLDKRLEFGEKSKIAKEKHDLFLEEISKKTELTYGE